MSLNAFSGAYLRHFFFQNQRIVVALASIFLNLGCLGFLWSQSFASLTRPGGHRSVTVTVHFKGQPAPRRELAEPAKPIVQKSLVSELAARPSESVVQPSIPTTNSEQSSPTTESMTQAETSPATPTDNSAFALPNQLNFSIPSRRRSAFDPRPRAQELAGNSAAEQQWRRQKAQADSHREMMVNILSELNKQARPNASMSCQTRPKVVCSADYEPALVILRRYESFFTDPNLRENFSFRFTEGRWSVDTKASP